MWGRAWNWVADLLPVEIWALVGIGVLFLAIAVPVAYRTGQRRASDAETAVRERVEAFVTSVADGEGGTACEMLSDEAARRLAERIDHAAAEAGQARSCEGAVRVAASRRSAPQTEALREADVTDVDYKEEWTTPIGENPGNYKEAAATAQLRGGEVELRTGSFSTDDAGNWTIESADPILDLMTSGR